MKNKQNTLIIAEVGQAHEGSLGVAHSFIDAVAKTGAEAIKFQLHIAKEESTKFEKFRTNFSYEDKSRYDYWKRMEFSFDQWLGLREHAKKKNLLFIVSPFSLRAIDIVEDINVDYIKIGSGEVFSPSLIQRALETNIPIIASTGMSTFDDIESLVEVLENGAKGKYSLLHCTSEYPVKPSNIGLNVLRELKNKFQCPIGFSDHSGEIASPIAAIALGAEIIEVHVAFSKQMFGPDSASSLTLAELESVIKAKKFLDLALNSEVNKSNISSSLKATKYIFQKKIITKKNLFKGDFLQLDDIVFLKANQGIPESDVKLFIGRELKSNLSSGDIIIPSHFKN